MFQLILVPWNASELCDLALETALELAAGYAAEIVALSVVTPDGPDASVATESFVTARAAAEASDVAISHEVVTGRDAARDVQAFAHAHGADLIVIGHHGNHPAGVLALHGVTEHLVAESDVPLLVVPGPPRHRHPGGAHEL